jgi:hypothetical protein
MRAFVQQPGDVVFVPRKWNHATLNLGEAVCVATQGLCSYRHARLPPHHGSGGDAYAVRLPPLLYALPVEEQGQRQELVNERANGREAAELELARGGASGDGAGGNVLGNRERFQQSRAPTRSVYDFGEL